MTTKMDHLLLNLKSFLHIHHRTNDPSSQLASNNKSYTRQQNIVHTPIKKPISNGVHTKVVNENNDEKYCLHSLTPNF